MVPVLRGCSRCGLRTAADQQRVVVQPGAPASDSDYAINEATLPVLSDVQFMQA